MDGRYPSLRAVTVYRPAGTAFTVYLPASSVIAPSRVPPTLTWTAGKGRLSLESVTTPVIRPVSCAGTGRASDVVSRIPAISARRLGPGWRISVSPWVFQEGCAYMVAGNRGVKKQA